MNKRCIIVIPVYKAELSDFERISLAQCKKVLSAYDIAIVCPENMDTQHYTGILGEKTSIVTFKPQNFKSLGTYSNLLRSPQFYKPFCNYEYMLIHHTDAFVFKDELEYWCNQGYDYIGAPIYYIEILNNKLVVGECIGIGNGGFSLRKTKSFLDVLYSLKRLYSTKEFLIWYNKYNFRGKIRYLPKLLKMVLGINGNSFWLFNDSVQNEDVFWGLQVPKKFSFKVPDQQIAKGFSIEFNYSELLNSLDGQMPFGCHGWYREDFLEFWKNKIEASGCKLP